MLDDVMNHTVIACGLDGILSALPGESSGEEGGASSEDEKSGPDTKAMPGSGASKIASGSLAIDESTKHTQPSIDPFKGNTAILFGSVSSASSSTSNLVTPNGILATLGNENCIVPFFPKLPGCLMNGR